MGHPMRLELTRVGLLVKLANRYTTKDAHVFRKVPYYASDDWEHLMKQAETRWKCLCIEFLIKMFLSIVLTGF